MFARKLLTGVLAGGVAASVIGLTAGTASAAYAPDPDDVVPTAAADLVGVGSDTSQVALKNLAVAYNQTSPAAKLTTFAATGGGTIAPPRTDGIVEDFTRPNGSGAGKGTLYNPSRPGVDFARSSSAQSTAETNAGLQSFPFALDQLATVTATASNAPASLTVAQLVEIYKGNITNWNQLGGSAGTIVPLIPQDGSGTRTFFLAQLQAANGGVAFVPNVATFQENDDTNIRTNPNAIAPFSIGRATLLGTLRVEGGFVANRAIYNVVRGSDIGLTGIQAAFGTSGYLCSAAAKPIIEASGFRQLFSPSRGGVCGQPTTSATSNFTVDNVATSTTVTVTSATASAARVVARVAASSAPSGTVTFFENGAAVASNVPLVSGAATATPAAAPGTHTYRAVYTPAANTAFLASEGTGSGVVAAVAKSSSRISESFGSKAKVKKKVKKGKTSFVVKPAKGSITIAGGTTRPTGTVLVKKGSKTVGSGSLVNGVAGLRINGLKIGTNKLTVTYGGDAATTSGVLSFTIKAVKPGGKKK